jgi:hypothetical protein
MGALSRKIFQTRGKMEVIVPILRLNVWVLVKLMTIDTTHNLNPTVYIYNPSVISVPPYLRPGP